MQGTYAYTREPMYATKTDECGFTELQLHVYILHMYEQKSYSCAHAYTSMYYFMHVC
jgi:hypothetical protein